MYSIILIRGNKLDSISTPNRRVAYRVYMNAVNAGYVTRLWYAKNGATQLIL
jgi:hypothetical protein